MVMSDIPTPKKAGCNDGGLTKFGGAPLGFSARGVLVRSMADVVMIGFWGTTVSEGSPVR